MRDGLAGNRLHAPNQRGQDGLATDGGDVLIARVNQGQRRLLLAVASGNAAGQRVEVHGAKEREQARQFRRRQPFSSEPAKQGISILDAAVVEHGDPIPLRHRRTRRARVAERLIFGDTTTGASNDIEKATDLARRMVTEFGMSDKLGPLSFGKRDELVFLGREIGEQRNYSDEVAKQIDEEVRAIIDKAYERATEVLTTHRDRLVALAEKLVAEETVDADTFETLFQDLPPKTPEDGVPSIVGPGQPIPEPKPQPA